MPLGTEVGRDPGDIVLDGRRSFPTEMDTAAHAPHFSGHVCCGFVAKRSPISATAELLCVQTVAQKLVRELFTTVSIHVIRLFHADRCVVQPVSSEKLQTANF